MIYDFKDSSSKQNWSRTVAKKNKTVNTVLGISKLKQVSASNDNLNQLLYKYSFDEDYEKLVLRKAPSHVNVKKYNLKKAYAAEQGLTAAKIKDLLCLCKSNNTARSSHLLQYIHSEKIQ